MIILIGMSGVGKSTIGKVLADQLLWNFVDSDDLLRDAVDMPVPDLLLEGEDVFLAKESEVLLGAKFAPHTVLATGGSVVYLDAVMRHLKQNGKCLYLSSSFAAIQKRVDFSNRGIVKRGNTTMQEVFLEREVLYQKWADKTVCVEGKSVTDSASEIVAWLSSDYRGDIKK